MSVSTIAGNGETEKAKKKNTGGKGHPFWPFVRYNCKSGQGGEKVFVNEKLMGMLALILPPSQPPDSIDDN